MITAPESGTETLARRFADASAVDVLRWAIGEFGEDLAVAVSFGVEDVILVHLVADLAQQAGVSPRLFTLDTGRLPEETHALMEETARRYRLRFEVQTPERAGLEALLAQQGTNGFRAGIGARRACCRVRKVEPLGRALAGARAWVTGLRRDQSVTRAHVAKVAVDDAHAGILKLSPLADWSERDVWAFALAHNIPTHRLHDRGVPSIGCAPCTRPVPGWLKGTDNRGVDVRAGRWWWERPEHKECGLHLNTETSPGAPR